MDSNPPPFESLQKEEIRVQSADSSKACNKPCAFN